MDIVQNFRIESADPSQLEKVAEFLEPFVQRNQILPRTSDELQLLVKTGFIALAGSDIVGFAAVEVYSQKLAELQCLAVAPHMQKLGIGRALIRSCTELAAQRKVRELMAITASEDIFRSCGFDYSLPEQKRALFFQPDSPSV